MFRSYGKLASDAVAVVVNIHSKDSLFDMSDLRSTGKRHQRLSVQSGGGWIVIYQYGALCNRQPCKGAAPG